MQTRNSSPCLAPNMMQPEAAFAMNWKQRAQRIHKEAHVFYLVFKHPRTRWYARLVAASTAAYLLSPIQLIPNFMPVIGVMDDLLVLFVGLKLLQRITPVDVLTECRDLADAAETRRKEEIRWAAAFVGRVLIVTVWFVAGIVASVLLAAHIHH